MSTHPEAFPVRQSTIAAARRLRDRSLAFGAILGLAGMLALALHLPQELVALSQNRERIRSLQEENNDLRKRREERRERLKILNDNFNEQELEIWRNLHLYRPGDTIYILPPKREATNGAGTAEPGPSASGSGGAPSSSVP